MTTIPNPALRTQTPRWLAVCAGILVVLLAAAAIFIAFRWPFSKQRTTASLQQALRAKIGMSHFRTIYFPEPGCVIDGFTSTRPDANSGSPIATANRVVIRATYPDFLFRPGYVSRIIMEGLKVEIPPRNSDNSPQNSQSSQKNRGNTRVGEVVANNATLTVDRSDGKQPLEFKIHSLTLNEVAANRAMTYSLSMTNALPPGEINAEGRLGSLNGADFSKTPLSGTAVLENANLAAFYGISGTLSSKLKFEGTFASLDTRGLADVPDFKVRTAGNSVHLHAPFQAQVNAMNGDVVLQQVKAVVDETPVQARGSITGHEGTPGKITAIDFTVQNGRIQDIFDIFAEDKSAMNGKTNFHARAIVRAFGKQFLKQTQLQAQFEIEDARYTNPQTQHNVDDLSMRAHRHKDKGADHSDPAVTSTFRGSVAMTGGIARFSELSVSVPAANAELNGTYNLLNDKVALHGDLRTETEIAKTQAGVKSVLLRPLDPLFKKKSAGAVIPVAISGTYHNPRFGMDLTATGKSKQTQSGQEQKHVQP